MKRATILIASLVVATIELSAQQSLIQMIDTPKATPSQEKVVDSTVIDHEDALEITDDTVYCIITKKQHGWFMPLDTIPYELTKHRNYIRFTNKNKAGHWLKMEYFGSYGNYQQGRIKPYILNVSNAGADSTANKEWIENVKQICFLEFVPDYTGKNIIQERAYDEHRNLVFSFSRVPIGKNQFNGVYKDANGFPAEMRNDDYVYGTLVRITEDQWGNDSIIQFLDAKGNPKPNYDGAAMWRYEYDSIGYPLRLQSLDIDGNKIIDSWGNCGVEYQWGKYGYENVTYMDNEWRPMRMPDSRANEHLGVMTVNYLYDSYTRTIEEYYTDSIGNSIENAFGTHRIVYTYNDKGDMLSQYSYDTKNQLSPCDQSFIAKMDYTYDADGNITSAIYLDKDEAPNSTDGYLSKVLWEYDENGNQISEKRYINSNGKERTYDERIQGKNYEYTLWSDGDSRLDSLDAQGRISATRFYGSDGKLKSIYGRAVERYTYVDEKGKCTMTETDYDENNQLIDVNDICKTVTLIDSTNWTKTKWRYNKNNELLETLIHQYDSGFNKIISQDDVNTFGVISRSGGCSEVRYYHGGIAYNPSNNNYNSLLGRDEFGEPDYITSDNITYYYSKLNPNTSTKFFDENNHEVEDQELIDQLPKVMTIEVVDSQAYKLGLRDNDIIILYGNYSANLDSMSYFDFRAEWSLRSILDADIPKRMVVFRITNAEQNEYGLYEISDLQGTPSEIGFIPHIRYLTQKQKARIENAILQAEQSPTPIVFEKDFSPNYEKGNNYIIMAYTEMYRSNRYKPYAHQITDPAILLGACIKDRDMYWTMEDGDNIKMFETMLESRKKNATAYPTMQFFMAKKMNDINILTLRDYTVYTNWFGTYITDEDYNKLFALYERTALNQMVDLRYAPSDVDTKSIISRWELEPDTALYATYGTISFMGDGRCSGTITQYGSISFNEGLAIFKIEKNYNGFYSHLGHLISFTPYEEVKLNCINLLNDDEELKERAITYVNENCKNNKDYYLKRMTYPSNSIPIDDEWYILDVSKNKLTIANGSENGIQFVNAKGKRTNNKKRNKNHQN